MPDYYQRATLPFVLKETDGLFKLFQANAAEKPTTLIERILELPSENLDLSEWFCHKHQSSETPDTNDPIHTKGKFNFAKFKPRDTELLFGQFFFLFNATKLTNLFAVITIVILPFVNSLGVETPEPEASLKPRHFNPHPYQFNRNSLRNMNYEPSASNTVENTSPKNGIYSQGPVQFPSDANNDNENELQALPQPYQRVALKSRGQVNPKPNVRRLDYDDLSSPLSKKHYAFSYTVRDATSGDDFSHTQKQEDGAVKGSYKVQLPDGRTQVVKYTADNNGYNAQVTYLDGQVESDDNVQPNQSPSLAPALASAQPIYDYYKTLQEQQLHNNENYNDDDYTDNKIYNHYNSYPTTTPTPYYAHSEAAANGYYGNRIQNVHIKTYNTAPHNQVEPQVTPLSNHVIIYSTTPAPYADVHVLPTPRTLAAYSTRSPYTNVVSAKSTNVLPGYDYYLDYDYRNGNGGASQSNNLFVTSNKALYFKTKK
ncbi:Cuticle protein 7 [Pseudolycoriella hygida]|uniref:Cuticle protein 7 n=1 Tax=Pseudolycoriella hygida TaxID=35572 RepID=A0A9Q0NAT4_9DIPT|nr:Cuticle protein 7 [Pseudolycoriella hygida]